MALINPVQMRRIIRRLEDYPEFRPILHTPERSDVTVEERYLAIIEILLNKTDRLQADLLFLQHPLTPKVQHGESYEAAPDQAEGSPAEGEGQEARQEDYRWA